MRLREESGLAEGERLAARGELGAALQVWTRALASAADPVTRAELAARLARTRRRVALRRLGPPLLVLCGAAPLAALGVSALVERGEATRRSDAAAALGEARDQLARGAAEPALERLASVGRRWPGTPAANEATALLGEVGSALERARVDGEAGRAALDRGQPGEAALRFEAALTALAPWPALPSREELRRARDRARAAEDLGRGQEALEEGDAARARELFALHADRAAEARRGVGLAELAEAAAAGEAALAAGEPGRALDELRRANGLARRLGQPVRDLAPLEAAWSELRRLRAAVAYERAAAALATNELAAARTALDLPDPPDDPALQARLDALRRLVAAGGVPEGMVLVPGAVTPRGDLLAPDELPLELVSAGPFLIDRHETTRGQVQAWLAATSTPAPPGWRPPANEREAAEPARGLSWHEASACAAWAGKRLPTELEWEAAARAEPCEPLDERGVAGRAQLVANVAASLAELSSAAEAAWLAGKAPAAEPDGLARALLARRWPWGGFWDPERCRLDAERPVPAGGLGASGLGIEDLAGSVAEWTASEYLPFQGPLRSPVEGKGRRVVRGGSFRSATPAEVRTGARAAVAPEARFDDLGFRCARDP